MCFWCDKNLAPVLIKGHGARVPGRAEDREAEERARRARILSERSAAIRGRNFTVDPPLLSDLTVLENLE
jgi:hypothetical protein